MSGANDASKAMEKMGNHAKQLSMDVSALKGIAIGAVVAKGVSMIADSFMQAGSAAASYAASVTQSVDAVNDLSERTGMGVESLQSLQMAAKLSGVDDATAAVQKLGLSIGEAAESGKTDAFTKLGLDFAELQAMSPDQQFRSVQSAIAALQTPAEKAAAAVDIFGKSGVELLPLMSKDLGAIEERMERLGAIVGVDQVEAIGAMNDALDMVQATFDGIAGNVIGNLAPVVESLANDLLSFVEQWNNIGGETGSIADTISAALLDIAEYFAGVFDSAVSSFEGFGQTLANVGAVFQFVGNVFTAVAETLRAGFNMFQVAGNLIAVGIGKLLEGLGSWVNKDLEQFGRDMAASASTQARQNAAEGNAAISNAGAAASRAIFGESATQATSGPAALAVRAARQRMTPEAKAERESARAAREAQAKAAREAAAAQAKAKREAEAAEKKAKKDAEIAKKVAKVDERIGDKQKDIDDINAERASALGGKSNEALKANDIRSSEGMAQFLALATGREDPAIEENRKTNAKLEEIRKELSALQQEKVEILGAAA